MTDDIVTRLRGQGRPRSVELPTILHEAADKIERLTEALKPFAAMFETIEAADLDLPGIDQMSIQRIIFEVDQPNVADLRRAHAAISSGERGK